MSGRENLAWGDGGGKSRKGWVSRYEPGDVLAMHAWSSPEIEVSFGAKKKTGITQVCVRGVYK